ncbi:MAG: vWA domain-containing protein [Vulcanimicrobiota bacterium]
MVLDNSGSMPAPAGDKTMESALSILKKACVSSLQFLDNGDRITVYSFAEYSKLVLPPLVINNNKDKKKAKKAIINIKLGGGAHLSTSLNNILKIKDLNKFYIKKAIVFTDGDVNVPSVQSEEKDCLKIAGFARKQGVPYWVYGTSIYYNGKFLRILAETGQADLATQLMSQAAKLYKGMNIDDMSTNLITFSNLVQQNGGIVGNELNTKRTLTTVSIRRPDPCPAETPGFAQGDRLLLRKQ